MFNLDNFKNEIKRVEEWLQKEYSQINTGRATPALIDSVMVESYGSLMPIKNVASISIEDPKTLLVAPWDKSQGKEIERALQTSNLGFSIAAGDAGVRVIVPALNTERRAQLVKLAKERLEDARISIRQAREDVIKALRDAKLPEDVERTIKDDLQALVDEANTKLESLFKKKESDITEQ
jgi:ribosome recycling factor